MKNKLLTTSILTFFLLSGIGSFAQNNSHPDNLNKIKDLTSTYHILTPQEQKELKKLLSELLSQTKDKDTLSKVAVSITTKIVNDRGSLLFLLKDLDKLSEDDYTSKIAKIEKESLKKCWQKLNKLIKDMKKYRPRIRTRNPLKAKDYLKIIKNNSLFITSSPRVEQAYSVLTCIKETLKESYPLLLKNYNNLLKKIKNKDPEEVLTDKELKFMKILARVKLFYQTLTIPAD